MPGTAGHPRDTTIIWTCLSSRSVEFSRYLCVALSTFYIPAKVLPLLGTYFLYQVVLKVSLGFFYLELLFLNFSQIKMKMSELVYLK